MWCNGKEFVSQCEGERTKSSLLQLGRLHIVTYAKLLRVPRYVYLAQPNVPSLAR
jgi:hypothetical protein